MTEGCYILRLGTFYSQKEKNDENLLNAKKLEDKLKELGFNIFCCETTCGLYEKLLLSRPSSSNSEDLDDILSVLSNVSSPYVLHESYHKI
jgi:hypothetical protein